VCTQARIKTDLAVLARAGTRGQPPTAEQSPRAGQYGPLMRTVAVVLAGGTGQRFGGDRPKQMRLLAGRSLVEHSVAAFEQADGVDSIMVVMPAGPAPPGRGEIAGGGVPQGSRRDAGGGARPGPAPPPPPRPRARRV